MTHQTFLAAMERTCDALDFIPALLDNTPSIQSISLAELHVPERMQKRIAKNTVLEAVIPEALTLREQYGVPFWMAMILMAQKLDLPLPPELLTAAAFHQPMGAATADIDVPSTDVTSTYLRDRIGSVHSEHILVISSRVTLHTGAAAHIPMLDFRMAASSRNLSTAQAVVRQLGLEGVILNSGQSYHFYGLSPLSPNDLNSYLAEALLFTPIIDYRWIAHQLIEGACALRLSPGSGLQHIPKVVGVVTQDDVGVHD
jgi:hypothetical protein